MAKTSKLTFLTKSLDPIRRSSTDNVLLGGDLNRPLTEVEKVDGRDKLHKKRTRNFVTASTLSTFGELST